MKKSEKPFFVDNLTEKLKSASGYVLVDFNGLTVKMQQDLKKKLREAGGNMEIVKNTLFKLSAEKAKLPSEIFSDIVLQGPTALIITDNDPISVLQVVAKYAKESEIPQLKVGVIEGTFQTKDTLIKLASLPGKTTLQAQLLGAIASPMYAMVGTLRGNVQKLLYILSEYKSKRV